MEFHQVPRYQACRSHAGDLPPDFVSPWTQTAFVDPHFDQHPVSTQTATPHLSWSSSLAPGCHNHTPLAPGPVRKRRRLESYSYTPIARQEDPRTPLFRSNSLGNPTSSSVDHLYVDSPWEEAALQSTEPMASPLARRMAEALCPCCGFAPPQADGYRALPQFSEDLQYRPYSSEKQPSMVSHLSETFQATNLDNAALIHPGASSAVQSSPIAPASKSLYGDMTPRWHDGGGTFATDSLPVLSATHAVDGSHPAPMYMTPNMRGCHQDTQMLLPMHRPAGYAISEAWTNIQPNEHRIDYTILQSNQRGGKRGPFKDPSLREQTAKTRKIGSCIRCRMQRIRCEHNPEEPEGDCLTCKKVANSKLGRFPCLRYKITDVKLHKPGQVPGYEWTRRWNNNISDPIQKWASSDIKHIRIADGYSGRYIELRVRRFVPQEGDKLERTWDYNGIRKSVCIPPYALENMKECKDAYDQHIRESVSDTFKKVLGRPDGLLYKTYSQAAKLWKDASASSEVTELLKGTFTLWMSIRLSTKSVSITGEETLGMKPDILGETHPDNGKIPLPPVLGAQLDLVLIHHIQSKLRRELLDKLQKLILKNKPETWFVAYLVTFILLHNAALITAHDASYARKHGMKRRFAREDKVKEYVTGANILLAHFHYCNKGTQPFSDDCKDQDLRTLGDLDDEQIQFVHATKDYAKRHERRWKLLKDGDMFEDDYYFVSQLFEEKWEPRSLP